MFFEESEECLLELEVATNTTTTSTSSDRGRGKRKYSKDNEELYSHYDNSSVDEFICKYCRKHLKGSNSTSRLRTHIENHGVKVASKQKQSTQTTLNLRRLDPHPPRTQKQLEEDLIIWIIQDQHPFRIVENTHFQRFISNLDARFKIPTRQSTRNSIMSMYASHKEVIKAYMRTIFGKVSLTADMWTSECQQRSYLGITVHFIDGTWTLRRLILDIMPFEDRHTASNMADAILQLLSDFNLETKTLAITTDNAASMVSCCNYLKAELDTLQNSFSHYRCIAHIINIAAQHGLKRISEAVNKVHEVMKKIKYSPTLITRLKDFCNIKGIKYLSPVLDVTTRWNSTWAMLDRFIYLHSALILLGTENTNIHTSLPTAEMMTEITVPIIICNCYY
jgi:hypothetical protein